MKANTDYAILKKMTKSPAVTELLQADYSVDLVADAIATTFIDHYGPPHCSRRALWIKAHDLVEEVAEYVSKETQKEEEQAL